MLTQRPPVRALAALALVGSVTACTPPPEPRFVRAADLGKLGPLKVDQPIVIEFDQGDVIPLTFKLDGPFVASPEGAPAIPLTVKRHFFLRIDKNGVKSSVDGKTFDWKSVAPGQFQVGVGATPAGPQANITIRTPTPPGL